MCVSCIYRYTFDVSFHACANHALPQPLVVGSVPAVHPSQWGLSEGEELGVDDGEHGLAAAVTVAQGAQQYVQETLGQQEGRQEA